MNRAIGLVSGLLFGAGLILGEMTNPARVIGYLDFFGDWDPTLMGVMGGAIAVHLPFVRIAQGRANPVAAARFAWPQKQTLDARLLVGAALFGAGWGLGGYCPGPSVVSAATLDGTVLVFVATMLIGMALAHAGTRLWDKGEG